MSFVKQFLLHTSPYESAESFWRWAAFTTIAAVVRDNCWRQLGDHRLYPNMYTLLIAPSAVHRKGPPVKLCEDLLKQIKNTKVISGRSSIQGILDELARGETDRQTGKLLVGGSAIWLAPELSAGIVNDPEAIKILTDIYEFREEYTSRLRGSGIFRIKNICFSMLAASNEELLRDIYDVKALYGGLLGRTFLVRPNEFRPSNSLFNVRDTVASFKELVEKLKAISFVNGEFSLSADAESEYDSWYKPFREAYRHKSDKSGVAGRIHTSVLKVAMILCLDQTLGLKIQKEHIVEAIHHCIELMPNYSVLVMNTGKSTISEVAADLINEIWTAPEHRLSQKEFLGRHFHQYDLELFEKCVATLSTAELIKQHINENDILFVITDKCKEKFPNLVKETAANDKQVAQ